MLSELGIVNRPQGNPQAAAASVTLMVLLQKHWTTAALPRVRVETVYYRTYYIHR